MRRAARLLLCCVVAVTLLTVTALPANAQLAELLNLLFPSPAAPPAPVEPAAPPAPASAPPPPPSSGSAPAPPPPSAGSASRPFPLAVPQIRRSPARSTDTLVELLRPVVSRGVPLETALLQVVSPFPVAGRAKFSHDWGFPRYTPRPHLHEGTDVFADFGTPIVTSEAGSVIRKGTIGAGGISVWVRGDSGMAYYYAHMQSWARGLTVGQRVEKGQVIGFVGDTGNAEGGSPHLHFEMHPLGGPGTPARDPKPFLDDALRRAEEQARGFIQGTSGIPDTAGRTILPGVVVTKEVDKLLQASTMEGPQDVVWLSVFDPTLGVLGLARHTASAGSIEQAQLTETEALEAQRLEDVRQAVNARNERLADFLENSLGNTAVAAADPEPQALIR